MRLSAELKILSEHAEGHIEEMTNSGGRRAKQVKSRGPPHDDGVKGSTEVEEEEQTEIWTLRERDGSRHARRRQGIQRQGGKLQTKQEEARTSGSSWRR